MKMKIWVHIVVDPEDIENKVNAPGIISGVFLFLYEKILDNR